MGVHQNVGTCRTCGKRCYLTKRAAKSFARWRFPGEHMSAYRCGEYWHVGHLPPGVRRGVVKRSDLIGKRETA